MVARRSNLNLLLAGLVGAFACGGAAQASDARLDEMFQALRTAPPPEAARLGEDIRLRLSNSGSPSMNLLLKRGRDALGAGDTALALELLGALTDHAPYFSEGWHARAIAHAKAGMIGPAMADLKHSLTLDPRNFTAIFSLGALLEEAGFDDLALRAYARVAAIHPHFSGLASARTRLEAESRGTDL